MRLQLDPSTSGLADSGQVSSTAAVGSSAASRASASRDQDVDSIGISGASAAVGRLAGQRAERIQQLAGAVRSGTYQVPSAAVSAAIVAQGFGSGAVG